jgi:hypothetical protein
MLCFPDNRTTAIGGLDTVTVKRKKFYIITNVPHPLIVLIPIKAGNP